MQQEVVSSNRLLNIEQCKRKTYHNNSNITAVNQTGRNKNSCKPTWEE